MNDEQFERDLRRVVDRAMRQQASPALHARVAETLATPPPRRHRWLAHGPALAAGIAAALVLVAAAALVFLLHPSATLQIGATPAPTPTVRIVGPGLPTSDAWAPDGQSFALDEQVSGSGQAVVHLFARSGEPLRQMNGWDLAWTGTRTFLVSGSPSGGSVVAGSLDSSGLTGVSDVTFAGLGANGHRVAALQLPWTDSAQARFVIWQAGTTGSPQQGIPLAWSPDGSLLAVLHVTQPGQSTGGEDSGWLELLRVPGLTPVSAAHAPLVGARGAPVFDASGTHLAWPWADTTGAGAAILDVVTGQVVTLRVGGVDDLAWDGARLLAVEWQRQEIGVFDAAGSTLPSDLTFADRVSASPSGIVVTYQAEGGSVTVRNGADAQAVTVCGKQVGGIAWAPDGRAFLASCQQDDGTFETALVELPGAASARSPAPSSTLAPMGSPSPAPCRASQLRVHGGRMGGGTGTVQADAYLTNVGTSPCTLGGDPAAIELLRADGSVLPTVAAAPAATPGPPVTLIPGVADAANLAINWSNWCGGAPGPLRIRITLPEGMGAVTGDINGPPLLAVVPRCDHPETTSALELLWSFSATP